MSRRGAKAEAYAWLGQVYEKKGDKAKAAELYKTAIELAPKYGYARIVGRGAEVGGATWTRHR